MLQNDRLSGILGQELFKLHMLQDLACIVREKNTDKS